MNNANIYDRDEIVFFLEKEILKLVNESEYSRIIPIWGMGGCGKIAVLRKFERLLDGKLFKNLKKVEVNLDLFHDEILSLLKIRKQFSKACWKFDFALRIYNDKTSYFKTDDDFLYQKEDLIKNIIEYIPDFAGKTFFSLGVDILRKIKFSDYALPLPQEEIDSLIDLNENSPVEIKKRLPELLKSDITKHICGKKSLFLIKRYSEPKSTSSDWFKKLFDGLPQSLVVVTSREKISCLKDILNTKYPDRISGIPDDDAIQWLQDELGEKHKEQYENILNITDRIPYYLKLYITQNKGKKHLENLDIKSKEDLLTKATAHFNESEIGLLETLATLNLFRKEILIMVARNFKIDDIVLFISKFIESSIVEELDNDFFRIKTIVADNILKSLSHDKLEIRMISCIEATNDCINLFPRHYYECVISRLFTIIDKKKSYSINFNEVVIDLLLYIYEFGIEKVALSFLEECEELQITDLGKFIKGICIRKIESPQKAILQFEQIVSHHVLGRHTNSLELMRQYANCLLGNYSSAEKSFELLNNSISSKDSIYWYYSKSRIYYADLLMLNGDFLESLNIFQNLINKFDDDNKRITDILESKKQIAHIHRFNFNIKLAIKKYKEVLNQSGTNLSLRAYALTGLAESMCLDVLDGESFFSIYEEGMAISQTLGHKNNIAKLQYAYGIACLQQRNYFKSIKNISLSYNENLTNNYISGQVFSKIAECYHEYATIGYITNELFINIEQMIVKIGIYDYLLLPLLIIREEQEKITQLKSKINWLDFEKTQASINVFLSTLRANPKV